MSDSKLIALNRTNREIDGLITQISDEEFSWEGESRMEKKFNRIIFFFHIVFFVKLAKRAETLILRIKDLLNSRASS